VTTDKGMNWVGIFFLAMSGINTMPEGQAKTVLLSICMIASAVVAFATKGSGLNKSEGDELINTTEDLKDVLSKGRE